MERSVPKTSSREPDSARRDRPAAPEVERPAPNAPAPDMGRPQEPGEPPESVDEEDEPADSVSRNPDERAPDKAPARDKDARSDLADVGEADGQRGKSQP